MTSEEKLKQLKTLAKPFSVLYISDDIETNTVMMGILQKFFTQVITSTSSQQAMALFKVSNIDIVLIDSDISDSSIFDTLKLMRKDVYDISICTISSLQDTDFLVKAIETGVNKYILKPIHQEQIVDVLLDMVEILQNRIDAKELTGKRIDKKNIQIVNEITDELTHSIPFPMIIVNNGKVVFINTQIEKLYKQKNISIEEEQTVEVFESIFEVKEEYCHSLKKIEIGKNLENKFLYKHNHDISIFSSSKHTITIPSLKGKSEIIVFNDIAPLLQQVQMIEYQKQKVENYKSILEEILIKKAVQSKTPLVSPNTIRETIKAEIEHKTEAKVDTSIDNSLDSKEIGILRREHNYKISAVQYIESLDDSVYEELLELKQTEEEIKYALDNFFDDPSQSTVDEIASLLSTYSGSLNLLVEFNDLSNSISSVSSFLNEVDNQTITKFVYKLHTYMSMIVDDLIKWRTHVFVTQDANDIHYLDSSLFSSVLQLQLNISGEIKEDEGDLELF